MPTKGTLALSGDLRYNRSMGRHKKPLACSRCGRTPDEVKLYANRYCVDCMSLYNRAYREKYKAEKGMTPSQATAAALHVQVLDADDDELVGTEEIK